MNGKKAHVVAVPFPAQGHVKPLMKLSRRIAKHGIKVTFVNIECIHEKIVAAAKMSGDEDNIVLVSIPDGLGPDSEDDPSNIFTLLESLKKTIPENLTHLIERINSCNPEERVTCVIADIAIKWILETVQNIGVEPLLFSPASAAAITLTLHISRLQDDGFLDQNGSVKKGEKVILSEDIPAWGEGEVLWSFSPDMDVQKNLLENGKETEKIVKQTKWLLINTCYDLETAACRLNPNFLPVGPLLDPDTSISCNFHPKDASCLSWLDSKPVGAVIYVSFGSIAVLSQQQLDELALGLELSGRVFLWVVRQDLAGGSRVKYPDGFMDRVSGIGKIVEWAPQEKILSHPSVACFLSHCGWNSTLEGLSKGVPFLCWPYFSDQYHNQNYICDKWEIGLRISPDENGIRSRHEIKKRIDMLFSNDNLKANAVALREICAKSVNGGGSSDKNFKTFVDHLRNYE